MSDTNYLCSQHVQECWTQTQSQAMHTFHACLDQESNADDRHIGHANVEATAGAEQRKDARDIRKSRSKLSDISCA